MSMSGREPVMGEFNPNEEFELADHDPNWATIFEAERELIEATIGDEAVEIEHIGSTSVPGLRAKPIIDILLVIESFEPIEHYEKLLAPLGYSYAAHGSGPDRLFFWKGVPRNRHLHIVEYATWEHQRHLLFRDYLRGHPEVAQLYEQVKRELALVFHSNRPAYTKGKTAFIKSTMARAVEEITNPSVRKAMQDLRDGGPPDIPHNLT
jgi:GrpB-like predicted nucleotidyltransferase (UPF0157 family)